MKRHRTTNMAEAAFLSMLGFMMCMEREGDTCVWLFEDDGRPAAPEAKRFQRGAARVEPNRYARELVHTRKAMFDFLDGSS